jgi:DNA segregation ATPase FtsK/SpoIIIE-like protein
MYEASQESSPSQETENQAKARRKDQISTRKRAPAPPSLAAREGNRSGNAAPAELLCDSWRLSNKQRLLSGFIGMAFVVPYTGLCLTHPEWTGHIGHRLSLALFSFLGQGALMMPLLFAYIVLSCAGLRPLRQTRYGFSVPVLVALVLLIERWFQTGGWLGRTLDQAIATAVGPGGAWLFTSTLVILLSLAFFPKAWGEMAHGVDLGQEHLRDLLLRYKERLTVHPSSEEQAAQLATSERERPRAAIASGPTRPELTTSVQAHQGSPSPHPFLSIDEPEEDFTAFDSVEEEKPRPPRPMVIEDSFDDHPPANSMDSLEVPPPPPPPRLREETSTNSLPTGSLCPQPIATSGTTLLSPAAQNAGNAAPAKTTLLSPDYVYPDPTPLDTPAPKVVVRDDPYAAVPRARPFELPPLALLDDVPQAARRPRSEDKSQALLDVLDAFGVKAKLSQIVRGPTVTRYELLPARGVKVSKFTSLTNDIALALASTSVRIEAPIPGKSAIGIEIPNEVTDLVVIKDILRDSAFTDSKGLTVALGKDLSGRPVVTDLQKMPHLLVAGTTGSGKSVCVNGLILSLLYRFTPDQLQLMMVDPKQVELSVYEDIPHLVGFSEGGKGEIIVDPKKAAMALHQVVELMEQRYTLFAECRVRNLAEYNDKAETPLPWFVVIIDELADLMMVASKSVETSICRIAQKARAAGIHLVLATQRPSADVITGLIKVNIPSRAAFAVSSQVDSRVILDSGGAEHLLGKGDMLFLPVDASDPKRLQGAYVTNDEISRVVEFWKGQHLPDNRIEFELKDDPLALEEEDTDEGSDDALLEEGLRAILNRDQASASMLQTDLKVGYARARRLLMAMEKKGWVSAAEGSKPRKILYSGSLSEGDSDAH